jgi:hypothetical protein
MALRVIWQYMDRSVTKKILYGPKLLPRELTLVVSCCARRSPLLFWTLYCMVFDYTFVNEKGMDVQIKYLTRVVGTVNESLICFTNIRKLGLSTAKIWSKYLQILLKKLISVCLYIIRFSLINWVSWRFSFNNW